MTINNAYYATKAADPRCSLEDAIMAYAENHLYFAIAFTEAHCSVNSPYAYAEVSDQIEEMCEHGIPEGFDPDAEWFTRDWHGNLHSISDEEAEAWLLDNFRTEALPLILDGSVAVPAGIQEIIDRWNRARFKPRPREGSRYYRVQPRVGWRR